ncbi:hypothetical protein SDC9_192489 [bioreactor metagenome]|uniref:Uncharacterized protein n=1 Tax=bioreactor metagenome TaxID=1076179 RepID=A0A645I2E8_9ZZZZ
MQLVHRNRLTRARKGRVDKPAARSPGDRDDVLDRITPGTVADLLGHVSTRPFRSHRMHHRNPRARPDVKIFCLAVGAAIAHQLQGTQRCTPGLVLRDLALGRRSLQSGDHLIGRLDD